MSYHWPLINAYIVIPHILHHISAIYIGVLWGNAEPCQLPEQDPLLDLEANAADLNDLNFPLAEFDLLPDVMDIDFDLGINGTLTGLDQEDIDNISVDSAFGSSPPHVSYLFSLVLSQIR